MSNWPGVDQLGFAKMGVGGSNYVTETPPRLAFKEGSRQMEKKKKAKRREKKNGK